MKKNDIVATYDYYTLDQARQIIKQEERQKARKKRIEQVETIKTTIILCGCFIVFPLLMLLHWIAFGY